MKHAKDFSWMMAMPSHVDPQYDSDASDIALGAQLLAELLSTIIQPSLVDKVLGPATAVNAFVDAWVNRMETQGIRLKKPDPYFLSRACYATRSTLPPPSAAFADHQVSLASGPETIESLVPLFVEFMRLGPHPVTPEIGHTIMREAVEAQRIWFCRFQGVVAGYILLGRITPRTIAIRNVFTLPDHRRKGIAEALVRGVTRYYLGAQPLGFEGPPTAISDKETKKEVCLNVSDPTVMKIYSRCGFMLGEDERDPDNGQRGWFPTVWRGVEPL